MCICMLLTYLTLVHQQHINKEVKVFLLPHLYLAGITTDYGRIDLQIKACFFFMPTLFRCTLYSVKLYQCWLNTSLFTQCLDKDPFNAVKLVQSFLLRLWLFIQHKSFNGMKLSHSLDIQKDNKLVEFFTFLLATLRHGLFQLPLVHNMGIVGYFFSNNK